MRKGCEVWEIGEDGERWENDLTGEIWEHSQDLWSSFKWRLVSTVVCFSLLCRHRVGGVGVSRKERATGGRYVQECDFRDGYGVCGCECTRGGDGERGTW